MDFIDQLKQFSSRVESIKASLQTEEATKTAIIMPFFAMLGYDVFNPQEFVPEFTADIGTKKMDLQPFLEVDISDIKEAQVIELKKFHKGSFDVENVLNSASELKYSYAFKEFFAKELQNPSDELLRLFLSNSYSGMKTQIVLDKFRPILKKSLNQYINEMMNDKIKSALSVNEAQSGGEIAQTAPAVVGQEMASDKIITTQEELEAYYAVKSLLVDVLDAADIVYKDTESYLTICFKGMVTKWICRLYMNGARKQLVVSGEDKAQQKFTFASIDELFQYREVLRNSAKRFAPVTV
jgi:hypothetical protein